MSRRMRLPKAPIYGNPAIDNAYAGLRKDHRFMSDAAHFTLHMIEKLNRHAPRKQKKRGLRFAHALIRAERNFPPQVVEQILQEIIRAALEELGQERV